MSNKNVQLNKHTLNHDFKQQGHTVDALGLWSLHLPLINTLNWVVHQKVFVPLPTLDPLRPSLRSLDWRRQFTLFLNYAGLHFSAVSVSSGPNQLMERTKMLQQQQQHRSCKNIHIPQQPNMHKTFQEIPWSKQRAELLLVRWLQQLVCSDVAVSLAVLHWRLLEWDWDAHTYLASRNQTQAELSQRWRSDPTLVAWLWIYESKLGKRIQIMLRIAIRPRSNEAINRSTI